MAQKYFDPKTEVYTFKSMEQSYIRTNEEEEIIEQNVYDLQTPEEQIKISSDGEKINHVEENTTELQKVDTKQFQKHEISGIQNLKLLSQTQLDSLDEIYFDTEQPLSVNEHTEFIEIIKQMNNIKILKLQLRGKTYTEEEAMQLRLTLVNFKQLTQFVINFQKNDNKETKNAQQTIQMQVQDEGALRMAKMIEPLKDLKSLNLSLSDNNISSKGFKAIGDALVNLQKLDHLQIWAARNIVTNNGTDFYHFAQSLKGLVELVHLTLCFDINWVRNSGAKDIGANLEYLTKLQYLKLQFNKNQIHTCGFISVVENIVCFPDLHTFILGFRRNSLDNKAYQKLTKIIMEKETLKHLELYLANSYISYSCAAKLENEYLNKKYITYKNDLTLNEGYQNSLPEKYQESNNQLVANSTQKEVIPKN